MDELDVANNQGYQVGRDPSAKVSAGVNQGYQSLIHTGDLVNPVFNHQNTTNIYHAGEKDYGPYIRALQVDPGDLKTNALGSIANDEVFDACWNWVLVHSTFKAWLDNPGTRLLWIYGGHGKGKTVMMIRLVDELSRSLKTPPQSVLVSYFFCNNMDDKANTASSILRGLIFGLAQKQRNLIRFLRDKYSLPEIIQNAPPQELWGVLRNMLGGLTGVQTIYLVVDALDECRNEDNEHIFKFLNLVRRDQLNLPHKSIKWLFASRPSSQFSEIIGPRADRHAINLDEETEARRSVDAFVEKLIDNSANWDQQMKLEVRDFLRQREENSFIYVNLVWKELQTTATKRKPSMSLLELKSNNGSHESDQVYDLMMNRVVQEDENLGGTLHQDILLAVLLAKRPLVLQELAIVAGLPQRSKPGEDEEVKLLVEQCGQFLSLRDGKVHFSHKSAKDYLRAAIENTDSPFLYRPASSEHARIARRCLAALESTLKNRDFSETSSLVNRALSDEERKSLGYIAYACCYWVKHAVEAGDQFSDSELVVTFLQDRFLPWVEALGHLDKLSDCIQMIQEVAALPYDPKANAGDSLKALAYDAFRFLLRYQTIIKHYPSQAYFLALFFAPRSSLIRQKSQSIPSVLKVTTQLEDDWGPYLYSIDMPNYDWGKRRRHIPEQARALGFSEDGKTLFLVSRTRGRNILRWHVVDGSLASSLEWNEDELAISSDGQLLASIPDSFNGKVNVWETESNHRRCSIDVPSRPVAASFSPGGNYIAMTFVENYFTFFETENVVKLWETRSGSLIRQIKVVRSNKVRHLVFSPTRKVLIMLIKAQSPVLWDIAAQSIEDLPLKAYARKKVEVTPETNLDPLSVEFSSSGAILALVVAESEVRGAINFWSTRSKTVLAQLTYWGTPRVRVAISADGLQAAVTTDRSIALWDLKKLLSPKSPVQYKIDHSGEPRRALGELNGSLIEDVVFSPCGTKVVCTQDEGLASVWDASTLLQNPYWQPGTACGPRALSRGMTILGGLLKPNRTPTVTRFTFSPNGRMCGVVLREDKSSACLMLFDVATGYPASRVNGISFHLECIVGESPWGFSQDGSFAVTLQKGTLVLVNTSTPVPFKTSTLKGIGNATAFAFNRDNSHLALLVDVWGEIRLIETKTCSLIGRIPADGAVVDALAFLDSGPLITSHRGVGKILFWREVPSIADDTPSKAELLTFQSGRFQFLSEPRLYECNTIVRMASSPDGKTVAIARVRTFSIGTFFVNLIAQDSSNSWTDINYEFKLGFEGDEIKCGDLATALTVSNNKDVAVAWGKVIMAKTKRGVFSMSKKTDAPVYSLEFGPGGKSLLVDGMAVALNDKRRAMRDCSVDCELGIKEHRVPGRSQVFGWLTWRGQEVLCLPDSIAWDPQPLEMGTWGNCLALGHIQGIVSFFWLESPSVKAQ